MPAVEIKLSTIGSRGLRLAVARSALPEAKGGAQIELDLRDGPLIVTLTCGEACWLAGRLLATREPAVREHRGCGRASAAARGTVAVDPATVPHSLPGKLAAIEVLDREVEREQAEDRRRWDAAGRSRNTGLLLRT